MKKLTILTATRAEYGLIKRVIKSFYDNAIIQLSVVVTGMHLSPEYGMTIKEIENDGVKIDKKIEILLSSNTNVAVSKAMGLAIISFAEYFDEYKPDAMMVVGDRYETLAVCIAAMNARIPIIHVHGGETTEGAIDEAIRHAISKMSYLHFASTDEYKKRIIQLGENPKNVYCVGALGVDNAVNTELYTKTEFKKVFGIDLCKKYAIGTFHPVTLEKDSAEKQVEELIRAISKYKDIMFIFTKANADENGSIINRKLDKVQSEYNNIMLVESFGMKGYLSAISSAEFVIGNSSSGIVEVPSYKIPTINIGDRQKGRLQGKSIINCKPCERDICDAIDLAISSNFREIVEEANNIYRKDHTVEKIVKITTDYLINERFELKKKFYDIEFEVTNE